MPDSRSHFYQRAEFYISFGAFLISVVALYFSYLSSPLSDISRAKIYYSTVQGIAHVSPAAAKELRLACEITNPTKNPAEDVTVAFQTDIKNVPRVEVLGGLEYQVLKNDGGSTTIKLPLVPPRSGAVVRLFAKLDPKDPVWTMSGDLYLVFTTVQHKHGRGIRER
jgi:hypothetical protein